VGTAEDPYGVSYWLNCHHIQTLNVAGPREGKHCPIYDHANAFLIELFQLMEKPAENNDYVFETPVFYLVQNRRLSMEASL